MLRPMDSELRIFLGRTALEVAPDLLGWTFSTTLDGTTASVRLTEVEAYMGEDDPASHAYRGMTARTEPMFREAGTLYVYLSYGIHSCVNIVTGPVGTAQAVLLRGGIPLEGVDAMVKRRGREANLTRGPGNLAKAMGLSTTHSGTSIDGERIILLPGAPPASVVATPRVGISAATDRLWRFMAAEDITANDISDRKGTA